MHILENKCTRLLLWRAVFWVGPQSGKYLLHLHHHRHPHQLHKLLMFSEWEGSGKWHCELLPQWVLGIRVCVRATPEVETPLHTASQLAEPGTEEAAGC